MPVILVLTATSPDKPGLIDLLSTILVAQGPNLQQRRVATLGGQFGGLLQASGEGRFIEVQGSAEGAPFTPEQLDALLEVGAVAIRNIFDTQRAALGI